MISGQAIDAGAKVYAADISNPEDGPGSRTSIIVIPYFLESTGGHFALVKNSGIWCEFHRERHEDVEEFVARVVETIKDEPRQ